MTKAVTPMTAASDDIHETTFVSADGKFAAILTSIGDQRDYVIRVGGRVYFFDFSAMFGPNFVSPHGKAIDNARVHQSAFRAVSLWKRQGKRTEPQGRHLRAIWNEPPAATYTFVKRGRSREIIHCDEPEGYDPDFSEEIFVEARPSRDGPERGDR